MKSARHVVISMFLTGIVALNSGAVAQETLTQVRNGYGIRSGFGLTPDQFVAGLQLLLGHRLNYFRLAPSFDLGFGDDVTTYTLNGDFQLQARLPDTRSLAYFGAGLGVTHWDVDAGEGDTELGLNLLAGTRLATQGSMNYTIEARFGVGDIPDFRFLVGILMGSGIPLESR